MGYNYTTFVQALSVETNIPSTNLAFQAALPTIIMQAEGKVYREPGLEFLSTMGTDDSGFASADDRQFTLPRFFTVLHSVNRVAGNERPPLTKISREALEVLYPRRISVSPSDVPVKWAPFTDQIIYLAPVPGAPVQLECTGELPPAALASDNPTTWLWSNLGDFVFAAAMIFASAYMRNFGSQADDPKMAMSWQSVYDQLLPGAKSQETRRKFEASGGGA
jgi:hypothetical protein